MTSRKLLRYSNERRVSPLRNPRTGDSRVDGIMPALHAEWHRRPFEKCLRPAASGYRKLKQREMRSTGRIPVVDQGEGDVAGYTDNELDKYPGPLPVVLFGDHTRRVKYIDFEFAVGADGTKILHPISALHPRFFYYYLLSLNLEGQGYSRHYRFLKEIEVPIPPPAEQHRVVAVLDDLRVRVEACGQRLARIPAILKRFRQAVLSAACSGRLTQGWSQDIGVRSDGERLPPGWRLARLGSLMDKPKYGTSLKCTYEAVGVPVLRIPNISNGSIDHSDLKYAVMPASERQHLQLMPGDILMIRSNGSVSLVGKTALVGASEGGFAYAGYLIRLRPDQTVLCPEYLNLALSEHSVRLQIEIPARSTSGVHNINSKEVRDLTIPLPPIAEQSEVARRAQRLLSLADQAEMRYREAKAQVDKVTQSILAKAFRGELVPTEAELARREHLTYEPASLLLDRVRAQRHQALDPTAPKATPGGRSKPRKPRQGRARLVRQRPVKRKEN
jgi:type I restriction enzyme S subunit